MNTTATDHLSELSRGLLRLNGPLAYGRLVVGGDGNPQAASQLAGVSPGQLLKDNPPSTQPAQLLLAGLWLWHDWLDESHGICQQIQTSGGSYWHAIVHRREGDFSNAKYWLARCPNHAVHGEIAARLPGLSAAHASDPLVTPVMAGGWNPSAFVDFAQRFHEHPDDPRHSLAVAIQRLEWQVLFDHCVRLAVS